MRVWFLVDSDRFFKERSTTPFLEGLIFVFFNGAMTFMTALTTLYFIIQHIPESSTAFIADTGIQLLSYMFLSSFLKWIGISVVFFVVVFLYGEKRLDGFEVLNITGLGFLPLVLASTAEFLLTALLFVRVDTVPIDNLAHVVLSGGFGILAALFISILHLVGIAWAVHIWKGGLMHMGKLSRGKTQIVTVGVAVIFIIEFLVFVVI